MPEFCQDCTCRRAQANGDDDRIEQVVEERSRPERSFTAPADWVDPAEGVEPAVPLRSKAWWNNPQDGEWSTQPV
jgi:dihydroxy-acid dehydratase